MAFEPYLRPAGDGTLELLVPSVEGTIHVLPYCFHTEEDAANWLASRKGREYMRGLRRRMHDRIRTDLHHKPEHALTIADVELMVREAQQLAFQALLVPAGVARGSEEDRSLVVVEAVDGITTAAEVAANLRPDEA